MLECTEAIKAYAKGLDKDAFIRDARTKDAICLRLLALGEAASGLLKKDPFIEHQYPQIPWRSLSGMRNIIAHEYFGIDYNVVWDTVQNDIPRLHHELHALYAAVLQSAATRDA